MNFLRNKKIKDFLKNSIFGLVLVFVLSPFIFPNITYAACDQVACTAQGGTCKSQSAGTGGVVQYCDIPQAGQTNTPVNDVLGGLVSVASDWIVGPVFKFIGYFLQLISGGILGISGILFDKVIQFTILEMSTSIQGEGGIGTSIDQTWGTLRDIANMFFILVLLFTAFKAMFELNTSNVSKTILNIIIVALLINFSMFFTKVVIDASNVVAIGFYNSIVNTGSTNGNIPNEGQSERQEVTQKSISSGYMRLLGLHSWYDPKLLTESKLDTSDILITGIMSSVFMLIVAVVMFVTSIMFVTRWILLVLLIILSPVAFITIIIPGLKGNFDKWMQAVINQSFFAPLYFALTWVVFRIAVGYQQSAGGAIGQSWSSVGIVNPSDGPIDLILKYFLIVGFSIAALILSKDMAKKTSGFTEITGAIGSGAVGGTAFLGRQTAGRAGRFISDNFRDSLSKTAAGRAALNLSYKAATGSFDVRGIESAKKIPGLGKELDILGKAGGKGGFSKAIDEKAKKKADYAKAVYGQSESEKERLDKMKEAEEGRIKSERAAKEASTRKESENTEKRRKDYMSSQTSEFSDRISSLNRDKRSLELQVKTARDASDLARVEELNKELGSIVTQITNEREAKKEKEKEVEENDATYKSLKEKADNAKETAKEAKDRLKKKEFDDEEYTKETQDFIKAPEKRQKAAADRVRKESPVSTVGSAGVGVAVGGALGTLVAPGVGTVIGTSIGAAIGATLGKKLGDSMPDYMNWPSNMAAARKIKSEAKGKSKKDKLADLAKEVAKEDNPPEEPAATPTTPTT